MKIQEAIINYDTIGYNKRLNKIESQKSHKQELDKMKKDIEEIKDLLKDFLKK